MPDDFFPQEGVSIFLCRGYQSVDVCLLRKLGATMGATLYHEYKKL